MQTIGSTFAAYHVAGTSYNIYDPLANVAAALNYARTVYGPSLMRGSMGVGSGHGYDTGGWLPPGVTMAVNRTGESELILSADQLRAAARGGDGGAMYVAHFDGLTGQAIEGHVRTAFAAMSVTQGNLNRQGRRR
jgi:SLT domain-containing protein